MPVLALSWTAALILSPLIAFLAAYIRFLLVGSKHWSKCNIPHLRPIFLVGNFWRATIIENFNVLVRDVHLQNKEKKLLGTWFYMKPTLMVIDLDLTKRILIRDFNHFRDRGMEVNHELDPLTGHLFFLSGVHWRNLRVKLTPTFTSGKMKFMFSTVVECGHQLQDFLRKSAGEEIEIKDVMVRFNTDVISSCAFGINANSLENPKSEFREFGRKFFEVDIKGVLTNLLMQTSPKMYKFLKLRFVPKDATDFFMNAVRDTVEYREKNNISRNDFLQLIIELMRNGKVEDVDKNPVDSTGLTDEELVQKFELKEAAAQCFVFFVAGFETSSTTLTFALYELALNQDIQKRLQEEIQEGLKRSGNELTYDGMMQMEYLDMVVQETLRKYPPVGFLKRICTLDYPIPEMGVTIKKGTHLIISVNGFHEDPVIYPKPEKFDPERFTEEERSRRHHAAFLPFGEGPRNCIGTRFGLMQVKIGLVSILREYNVEVSKRTPIPLVYDKMAFIPNPAGGMHLVFRRRH